MEPTQLSPSSTVDMLPFAEDAEAPAAAGVEIAMLQQPADGGSHSVWMRDAIIGVLGGFFSVMSATGGAFITIPMLLLAHPHISPTHAVSLGQAITVPITACTGLVAALSPSATLDVALAAAIGAAITLGVPAGVRLAQHTKPARLTLAIAVCLLAGGATALEKTIHNVVLRGA